MNCAIHTNIPATAYCRTCGKALCESCKRDVKGVIFCQDCLAARLEGTVPAGVAPGAVIPPPPIPEGIPNPALATILGFIPGVGAFYNGQFAKGFIHLVVFAILIKLTDSADFFGVFIAAWFFYMAIDAYRTAKARQLGLPLPDPLGLNNLFGLQESAPSNPAASVTAPASAAQTFAPPVYAESGGYATARDYRRAEREYRRANRGPTGAIILIGLGVLFLLDNLGVFHWSWTGRYWPAFLIAFGLYLAARRILETHGSPQEQSNE